MRCIVLYLEAHTREFGICCTDMIIQSFVAKGWIHAHDVL